MLQIFLYKFLKLYPLSSATFLMSIFYGKGSPVTALNNDYSNISF